MGTKIDSVRGKSGEVKERFRDAISDGQGRLDTARQEMDRLRSLPTDIDEELVGAISSAMDALKADAHSDVDSEVHSKVVESAADGKVLNQQANEQISKGAEAAAGLQEASSIGEYGAGQIADAVSQTEANMGQYQDIINDTNDAIQDAYTEVDRLQQEIDSL